MRQGQSGAVPGTCRSRSTYESFPPLTGVSLLISCGHTDTHTVSSWPACYSNVSPTSWMAVMTTCCTDSSIIIMVWMYSTHTEEQSPLTCHP